MKWIITTLTILLCTTVNSYAHHGHNYNHTPHNYQNTQIIHKQIYNTGYNMGYNSGKNDAKSEMVHDLTMGGLVVGLILLVIFTHDSPKEEQTNSYEQSLNQQVYEEPAVIKTRDLDIYGTRRIQTNQY